MPPFIRGLLVEKFAQVPFDGTRRRPAVKEIVLRRGTSTLLMTGNAESRERITHPE